MTELIHIVLEDRIHNSAVRAVFSNEKAAQEYVNDDRNVGNFHITTQMVENTY